MATDTRKIDTVTTTDIVNPSVEENPKKNVSPIDLEQIPDAAVNSAAVEVKKEAVTATVSPVSGDDAPVTHTQKKIRRAERFGMPVQLSEQEKRNSRAERFGTGTKTQGSQVSKTQGSEVSKTQGSEVSKTQGSEVSETSEELKRKARAERFGLPVPSSASDEGAKRKARLARFAPNTKTDSLEEDKRKARALRFSETSSSSVSEVNGKGNIDAKAAITGEAGGVA